MKLAITFIFSLALVCQAADAASFWKEKELWKY